MSVTDPLLRALKTHLLTLLHGCPNEQSPIPDGDDYLYNFCLTMEEIFRLGLKVTGLGVFGITKRDYWFWMEDICKQENHGMTYSYLSAVESAQKCLKTATPQGRGRLLIRTCLVKKCLHEPVEYLVRRKFSSRLQIYDEHGILGDEILGEIFLSVLNQCSKMSFQLCLKNSSFLDETWSVPDYVQLELVPCTKLGLCLGFVRGRAIVVKVDANGVAGEDNKVELGDCIDELNNKAVIGYTRGQLSSLLKDASGSPVQVNICKSHYKSGELYTSLIPLFVKLDLDTAAMRTAFTSATPQKSNASMFDPDMVLKKESKPGDFPDKEKDESGYAVTYLGQVIVGKRGDMSHIDSAIVSMIKVDGNENSPKKEEVQPVLFKIKDLGLKITHAEKGNVILKKSFTEISSCGRRVDVPQYFGFIVGNTTCSLADEFTCHIFESPTETDSRVILCAIAQGFKRTHWAV